MKKIYLTNTLLFILIICLFNIINVAQIEMELKNNNLDANYIETKIEGLSDEEYKSLQNSVDKNKITFFYLKSNKALIKTNTITTNSKSIKINDQKYNLEKEKCLSSTNKTCKKLNNLNSNKYEIKYSGNQKFSDGIYFFQGQNLEKFTTELNQLYQQQNNTIDKEIVVKIQAMILLVFIIFLLILNIFLIINIIYTNSKKRNLFLLEGTSKNKITLKLSLKFLWRLLIVTIPLIIIVFILFGIHNSTILALFLIIIFSQHLIYTIGIFLETGKNLNNILKGVSKNINIKIIYIFKIIINITLTLILVYMSILMIQNIEEYKQMNKELNIRNDYGRFQGTSQGNDTLKHIESSEYQETVKKASDEIFDKIDYFSMTYGTTTNDETIQTLTTTNKYLDYNKIYTAEGKQLKTSELEKDTCYYLVPSKYIGKFSELRITGNCDKEQTIEIKDNQKLPTYQIVSYSQKYRMISNPIISIMNKEYTNQYNNYASIYYEVNSKGEPKNSKFIYQTLKKYNLYDNTLAFKSMNEQVNYLFLGTIFIIKILALNIILLLVILIYILNLVIKIYFEQNYKIITMYKLEGIGIKKRYKKLLGTLFKQGVFELLIVQLLIKDVKNHYIIFLLIVLLINIINWIIIILYIKKIEKKKEHLILKGEQL